MAKSSTSIYGFSFRKSLVGVDSPAVMEFIIEDSSTVTIGDAVRIDTSGYLKRAGAGYPVGGIVVGIVDQGGINIFSPRASGTTGATLTKDDTVAVSATNTSDATRKIKAQVILSPAGYVLFYNYANDVLAQTNLFQFFDVTSTSGQIDVSTASDTSGQFQLIQLDPDGDGTTYKGLFRVMENQLALTIGNSTAIVSA